MIGSMSQLGITYYTIFLCLDVILVLRNPFYPCSRRMKYYHLVYLGSMLLFSSVALRCINMECDSPLNLSFSPAYQILYSGTLLLLQLVRILISVSAVFRARKRIKGNAFLNSKLKAQFIAKYFAYAFVFLIASFFSVLISIYALFYTSLFIADSELNQNTKIDLINAGMVFIIYIYIYIY